MVIAYLRVGTTKQHLDEQRDEIEDFASGKGIVIDKWVTETAAEKTKEGERTLDLLIARMQKGYILIVSDVSRLGRTLSDVMSIMASCLNKGVHLYCLKDRYILDDKYDTKVIASVFSMAADIEHSLMSIRTKEALAHRKIKGVPVGRPKGSDAKQSFLDENREELINMLERGETVETICKRFNVSRNTYYQFRKNYKI
jgi:DNA invertase Pin-like site-specific DNA recombinase